METSTTPILVGVAQFVERVDAPDYRGLSAADIAGEAAKRACADALSLDALRGTIDAIATTRTFEDSSSFAPAPFGKASNFPRAIAKRLAIDPPLAVWEKAGGNSPQSLIADMCGRIADGKVRMALVAGAEAISTVRHLKSIGESRDFSEKVEGEVEDHGPGLKGLLKHYHQIYKIAGAPPGYALFENARRNRLGLSREAYALEMGRLFAPFTKVAADNPYSSREQRELTAEQLVTVDERNRMIADPYPLRVVSRDQVNQGAAVLLTSVGLARELGIPESKWIYLHAHCELHEREIIEREDIGASIAARTAAATAIEAAGLKTDDISYFDFYSCFPIAVSNVACDGLGLSPEDPRGLTVTGGLPYFGGPGNNYSMHAVATMVKKLRAHPEAYGFVGANGGFLSKYAAAIYSARATTWKRCDSAQLQARIDGLKAPELAHDADGWGAIETYTVVYQKGGAAYGIIIGRLDGGARFVANTHEKDPLTLQQMVAEDPLNRRVFVRSTPLGNRFAFSEATLRELLPEPAIGFRDDYRYCLLERRGRVLEITINRPEVRNALHPMANDELAEIMDAYFADDELWVAVLTGAGTEAFSAGNDLKYSASGKPMWMPASGFGGLTSRRNRSKPVIAAVNGYACGGGLEICLACDIVVADENAQLGLTEVRVGLIAGAGGLVRLPRQIPRKVATEMILTGRTIGADEASKLGLVNRVAPAGRALEAARAVAAEILESSPTSVRLSLQLMNETEAFCSDIAAVEHRSEAVDELLTSEDMIEGLIAFGQKRKPQWKNR